MSGLNNRAKCNILWILRVMFFGVKCKKPVMNRTLFVSRMRNPVVQMEKNVRIHVLRLGEQKDRQREHISARDLFAEGKHVLDRQCGRCAVSGIVFEDRGAFQASLDATNPLLPHKTICGGYVRV